MNRRTYVVGIAFFVWHTFAMLYIIDTGPWWLDLLAVVGWIALWAVAAVGHDTPDEPDRRLYN